jgi:SWI/SNF-related matrix-associated actin-dependent regulator of chromatin subfamily A member 5
VINSQKVQATAAQHRWLYHHKHLFTPLVGAKGHFFANLETEIKGLAPEKRSIVKFHEIERQPKLIEGGQMKDYQVRGT